jgi:hypothetical protein
LAKEPRNGALNVYASADFLMGKNHPASNAPLWIFRQDQTLSALRFAQESPDRQIADQAQPDRPCPTSPDAGHAVDPLAALKSG